MDKRERVIKGLECCEKDVQLCYGETVCEYYRLSPRCWTTLAHDALALIRQQQERIRELEAAQTARVMTLDEVSASEKPFYFEAGALHQWAIRCCISGDVMFLIWRNVSCDSCRIDKYNKTWRCWTQRPTDEQREAVKWDDR